MLADDGATFIIAIDHPARGMVESRSAVRDGEPSRVLERTMVALADPGVDGVMATPDILDDLALLGASRAKSPSGP